MALLGQFGMQTVDQRSEPEQQAQRQLVAAQVS
jgi:hypothetical protein